MELNFENLTPSIFTCKEHPRFTYKLERKNFDVFAKVYNNGNEFLQFSENFTSGFFILYILKGEEYNMPFAFKRCHKKCRKAIMTEIKNGC